MSAGPGAPASWSPGSLVPDPGAAPWTRMLAAQTGQELRLTLRKGESLLLTLVIPVLLLVFFSRIPTVGPASEDPVGFVVPGVLALAVMSSAFTGLAISTGFDRSYGVLKRLGATALPRSVLLAGKTSAVLVVQLVQLTLLSLLGLALGWRPGGGVAAALLLVAVATTAFAGLAFLMAGTLRAEATLALANLVYVLLLGVSGMVYPLSGLPSAVESAARLLPSTALAHGLREVLTAGASLPVLDLGVLTAWAVLATAAAVRTFRWE